MDQKLLTSVGPCILSDNNRALRYFQEKAPKKQGNKCVFAKFSLISIIMLAMFITGMFPISNSNFYFHSSVAHTLLK